MTPDGDKIRVTARISKDLDTRIHHFYTNVAPAIIEGLELLVATREDRQSPAWHQTATTGTGDMLALIGDKDRQIEFLKEQLAIKDSQIERQSYSLQSLIQLNSALNMKLLPEKVPVPPEKFHQPAEEPEITSKEAEGAATIHPIAKEIIVEDEPAKPLYEVRQHVSGKKTQKTVKAKPEREVECAQCGKIFSASSEKARFCSGKCRTAYNRGKKKLES